MNIRIEDFRRLQKTYQPDFNGQSLEKGSIRLYAIDEDGVKHSIILHKEAIIKEFDPLFYKRVMLC